MRSPSRAPTRRCTRFSKPPRSAWPPDDERLTMITDTKSTEMLVDALATRLRVMDLLAWQRITTWAEQSELSFEDLRLLLALAMKSDGGPATIDELGELAGLSLDVAYPATHSLRGRGYLSEDRRHYSLSQTGRGLVADLHAAHREGIHAYVETLDQGERERLLAAFADPR